ncbi:MAG: serine hydrolase domain-containing protein [Planctomycetota bacterium JB042]
MLSLSTPLPIVFALVFAPAEEQPEERSDLESTIDSLAAPLLEEQALGLVLGVRTPQARVVRGFGRVAFDDQRVPDGDTVFEIGSVTKVFTGLLLADAIERGRASLDDPIERHVPEGVDVCDDEGPVTLRHLVTHTSGLPRMPENFVPRSLAEPYADYDAAALHAYLADFVLENEPGSTYAYSNLGSGLLGELMGRAHGAAGYEEALRERIFVPLGLEDTTITLDERLGARFADAAVSNTEAAHAWEFDALAGCGAIRSTVNDLLRFGEAQLETEGPLAASIARSHERLFDGRPPVAYGWHLSADGKSIWHNGQTGGFHGWLSVNLETGVVVAALSNGGAGHRVDGVAQQVAAAAGG